MKLVFLFALLLSNLAFAKESYYGTFNTENLGKLSLELDFEFLEGKSAHTINSYYQEHIDNGQWGDWICENKATFKESLKIAGRVYSDGELVGNVSNDRYDQKQSYITINETQSSSAEFNCELWSLKNSQMAYFHGYDALIKIGKFTVHFNLRGSRIPVTHTEVSKHLYRLDNLNVTSIIDGTRHMVQWSVNVDHGTYSNNYEWGHVNLKPGDL